MVTNAHVDALLDIAEKAFNDAVEIHKIIAVLDGINEPAVVKNITKKKAGIAAYTIRHSLFWRLHLLAARSYAKTRDKVQDDDRHLRRAFELLQRGDVKAAVLQRGHAADLAEAQKLWTKCNSNHRLQEFLHFRDKQLVHLGKPDASIPRPLYNDVFSIARATAEVMEKLANGTGIVGLSVDSQMVFPKRSIDAFWKPWRSATRRSSRAAP
jgi:hypothetical protein